MKKKLLFSIFILFCCLRSFGQAEAFQPADLIQCNNEVFNLTVQTPIVLGNQSPNEFTVNYFLSGSDAETGANPIANTLQFVAPAEGIIIFVRVSNTADNSYAITQFTVSWLMTPILPVLSNVTACDVYTLPPLQNEEFSYYFDISGTSPIPFPYNITQSMTVYVIANNGLCISQGSFNVTIMQTPFQQVADVSVCDGYSDGSVGYILPLLQFGNYYTGPNGTGTMIPIGSVITANMTIYVHSDNGICNYDESFTVTFVPGPVIAQQPAPLYTICPGGEVALIVDAEGPNLIYQWTHNGITLNETGNVLTATVPGVYQFFVNGGNDTCTSIGNPIIVQYESPEITLGFPNGSLCPGETFIVSVQTEGEDLTFQWDLNGEVIPGATGPAYVGQATFENFGTYTCTVTGTACGVPVSSSIDVNVSIPFFSLQPLTTCVEGGTATFNLNAVILPEVGPATIHTFHATLQDAQTGVNPINPNNPYVVTDPQSLLWVRIVGADGPPPCGISISVLELIGQECTGNTISGTIHLDTDNNGCTSNDGPASGIQVMNIHNNDISYAYTNSNGEFTFTNVADGYNYLSLAGMPSQFNAPVPLGHTYLMEGNTVVLDADFCLTAAQPVTDAVTYLWQMGNARPGFTASYMLYIYNNGTVNLSGNASLSYDTGKLDYIGSSPVETSQIANTLNFYITDLAPSQYQAFYVSFTVKVPPIVNLGDVLTFNANMDTVNADASPYDNAALLNQIVVNSYDPNEIVVQQGAQILQNQVPDYLNYTIHFQNTGNAEATYVRLESDLDAKLDWTTFRPVASTHNYTSERIGDHIVFKFDNINLPGSMVDEPGSNGYVTYKVKPKATLALGDIIEADADIYFDFNLPIATNTVMTELVSILNTNHNDFVNLEIYPNPARGYVSIRFNENVNGETTISVFDMQGKSVLANTVMIQDVETSLDISKLQTGMYFVKLVSGNKNAVKKLVVK